MVRNDLVSVLVTVVLAFLVFAVFLPLVNLPESSSLKTSVAEMVENPQKFDGQKVVLKARLDKKFSVEGATYILDDGSGEILVYDVGGVNLNLFVGRKVSVEGTMLYASASASTFGLSVKVVKVEGLTGTIGLYLEFARSGGVASSSYTLVVMPSGEAVLLDRYRVVWNASLSQSEIQNIRENVVRGGLLTLGSGSYPPKPGAADFFTYHLHVVVGSDKVETTKSFNWVDEGASSLPIPTELRSVQDQLLFIIQRYVH